MKRRSPKRRVLVITGSRSEFGLLRPVMQAVRKQTRLRLQVAVAGEHLLAPADTWKEVAAEFCIDAKVPMQRRADRGRLDHAAACARGMAGFAAAYKKLKPDWVVVLGDRIEAFAAASAASIAGIGVCHIHGGDRAEGIADEAMRHAITKLAHLHCAATKLSADRIRRLGENPAQVFVTGSPAIDGLDRVRPLSKAEADLLGDPTIVVLVHPSGISPEDDAGWATTAFALASVCGASKHGCSEREGSSHALLVGPNCDPGSERIRERWHELQRRFGCKVVNHLPRGTFLGLLRRLSARGGVLIGNSSAGLIEAAALKVRVINLGPRQNGRERGGLVVDMPDYSDASCDSVRAAYSMLEKDRWPSAGRSHPYGDGRAGPRIAALLAKTDPHDPALLRKRNSY
jgi:UDP-hydrolysing UDP-N-acetyl-D-glucosamine 2-epimerase